MKKVVRARPNQLQGQRFGKSTTVIDDFVLSMRTVQQTHTHIYAQTHNSESDSPPLTESQ